MFCIFFILLGSVVGRCVQWWRFHDTFFRCIVWGDVGQWKAWRYGISINNNYCLSLTELLIYLSLLVPWVSPWATSNYLSRGDKSFWKTVEGILALIAVNQLKTYKYIKTGMGNEFCSNPNFFKQCKRFTSGELWSQVKMLGLRKPLELQKYYRNLHKIIQKRWRILVSTIIPLEEGREWIIIIINISPFLFG